LAVRVAGKTSSAEHKKGAKAHAWFIGYAPAETRRWFSPSFWRKPATARAYAAPVAYKFLKEIYGLRH